MTTDWQTYLTDQGATITDDQGICFPAPPTEPAAALCVLGSQALVAVSGADSERLLQGQLSCNMASLPHLTHTTGVACTPKGRMYASFRILNAGDRYWLAMHAGLIDTFLAALGKYAVFYQSQLSMPQPPMLCFGLLGDAAASHLQRIVGELPQNNTAQAMADAFLLPIADGAGHRFELWLPAATLSHWWPMLTATFVPINEVYWQRLNIQAVWPRVRPEYCEKYIPQHLNLPALGSISFRKGCYTGQEIVARMQHLGQQKSQTYHLSCHPVTANVLPTTPLINQQGQRIGEVLEGVYLPDDHCCEILAVVRIASANAGDVYVDGYPDSTITVHPIPYAIDPKAVLQK